MIPFRIIALLLNRIFCRANGTIYKLNQVPLIYYTSFEGTIYNWEDFISDSLSSCVAAAYGGLTQKRAEFYMSSYLIDYILSRHPFPKLGCIWNKTEAPVSVAYQILWAHKYVGYYKLICEEFLIPLYWIIFLKE